MVELPPIEIKYVGEREGGHDFDVRLIFDQATINLPLRLAGRDMALHGPEPKDDPTQWAKAACLWAERKFHAQYMGHLANDSCVLDQGLVWEMDDLPLYLHFAD